ncbi:Glycerophosphoryl diester phosphodiesterase [Entamoeba marina]
MTTFLYSIVNYFKQVFIVTAIIYGTLLFLNAVVTPKNAWTEHQVNYKRVPAICAHRGGRGMYPENTLEAMKLSYTQYGVDMLETDVQLTKDGHFVLHHDWTLDRNTNGTGKIADYTLAELKQLDAAYYFTEDNINYPLRNKGVKLSTLVDLLDYFKDKDVIISIELKDRVTSSVDALVDLLSKYKDINKKVCIDCSYHPMQLYWRSLVGDSFCTENDELEGIQMGAAGLLGLSRLFYFFHPNHVEYYFCPLVSDGGFDLLTGGYNDVPQNELGAPFMYFTVNSEIDIAKAVSLGAKGIITDRPDIAHKVLTTLNLRNSTALPNADEQHFHVKYPASAWEYNGVLFFVEYIAGHAPRVVSSFFFISIPVSIIVLITKIVWSLMVMLFC